MSADATPTNAYPFYSPRFWHGMCPKVWRGLLRQGGYAVSPTRLPLALGVTIASGFNAIFAWMQGLLFRRRLREAVLHGPPVFIIGHWRSGTTLLHELLVRDERFSSPSTFQCFAPSHFLLTEWFFERFGRWLLPGKRPMDNMATGWSRPQEDEFALVNLGLPSPYRRIAFPNRGPVDMDYLDFENVAAQDVDRWMDQLRRFLIRVSAATRRPLVIKSPTHTGRIGPLAKAFPNAKFIHITRDPRAVFPSTVRLWRSLDEVQGLQITTQSEQAVEAFVHESFQRMYDSFEAHRDEVPPHHLIDIRYEDLVADPVNALRNLYQSLRLADFETIAADIQSWTELEHQHYQTNKHRLDPQQEHDLRTRWQDYFQKYGYE